MNTQHSNEMKSIRKKLLAAIAMLLVAVIMTVSSTYAWFTLSTAPEVKGITTTVGANGNLEIALGTYETVYGTGNVTANEGDSMDNTKDDHTILDANVTWGNLIDLSDASYGLGTITLYPTRLNASAKDALNGLAPLQYALYGTDGRVTELSPNTTLGKFNTTSSGFETLDAIDFAGVNAIGSVSDMSPRKFAERNYRNAIDGYRVSAQSEAKGAISLYAGDLAGMALDNQNSNESTVIANEETGYDKITTLENLINKLEKANDNIGLSLKSAALLSITCTPAETLSDIGWKNVIDIVSEEEYTVQRIITEINGIAGTSITLPSQVTGVIQKHEAIYDLINDAREALSNAATDNVYTWGEISDTVAALLNKSGILICDQEIQALLDDFKAGGVDGGPVEKVFDKMNSTGLEFQFDTESGIFADIAELAGEYNTKIKFPDDLKVESIPLGKQAWPVTVKSRCIANTEKGDLGVAYTFLLDLHAPTTSDPTVAKALTDTYGYTIDMIFRTNATDSQLQLQTEAANRIYTGNNDNADLMGGGSNMSFTLGGEYTADKINALADGVRVVFYESALANTEILTVAKLDTANATESGDKYIVPLKLQNFDVDSEGIISNFTDKEDASICALSANVEKKITALVYLDGDVIDNSNVGLVENLNGMLNLQFSSSATLTPMANNTLMNTAK